MHQVKFLLCFPLLPLSISFSRPPHENDGHQSPVVSLERETGDEKKKVNQHTSHERRTEIPPSRPPPLLRLSFVHFHLMSSFPPRFCFSFCPHYPSFSSANKPLCYFKTTKYCQFEYLLLLLCTFTQQFLLLLIVRHKSVTLAHLSTVHIFTSTV